MILKRGRDRTVTTDLRYTTTPAGWSGPAYEVWLGGPPAKGGVLIGHLARRTPRSKRYPACDMTWHATTDTRPPSRRSAWWSAFDRTEKAEAFLLGMYLAGSTARGAEALGLRAPELGLHSTSPGR